LFLATILWGSKYRNVPVGVCPGCEIVCGQLNSLECGDLSPLLPSKALTLESGDKSPHSKELSYPHTISNPGRSPTRTLRYLEPDRIVARDKQFIHSFVATWSAEVASQPLLIAFFSSPTPIFVAEFAQLTGSNRSPFCIACLRFSESPTLVPPSPRETFWT
jgi:hypothetical protein